MHSASSAPRILIVEPHKGGLAAMARRLGTAGYRVIACAKASDAISELHRARPELMLAELRMTPMSGIDLTRLVRDDSALADLPIILINGRSDSEGSCEGLAAGADDIVTKPFDFDMVIARIARALARARSMKELRRDNAALDARVIERAIQLGEARAALQASEAQRALLALRTRQPD
jgi:DNA-binding response OmpR family regulator